VESDPCWEVRRPIRHGHLADGSMDTLNDLDLLLLRGLQKLGLTRSSCQRLALVLVVPSVFHRPHAKALLQMLFQRYRLQQAYLAQESVVSTFAVSVQAACVVDIGYEKTTVCCVSEGIIIPNSLLTKNFGLRDIDLLMAGLLADGTQEPLLNPQYEGDLHQLERIREKFGGFLLTEDHSHRHLTFDLVRRRRRQPSDLPQGEFITEACCACFERVEIPSQDVQNVYNPFNEEYGLFWD
jgi:hypothetical protein